MLYHIDIKYFYYTDSSFEATKLSKKNVNMYSCTHLLTINPCIASQSM